MKNNKELESCVLFFFNQKELHHKKEKISKIHKIVQLDFFIQNELTNQEKLLKINKMIPCFLSIF